MVVITRSSFIKSWAGCGILLVACLVGLYACRVSYSFTGASIPPEVHTVSIEPFPNLAPLVNPTLSTTLTEALKDRFLNQTRLSVQEYDADFQFSGEITNYAVEATAIQGNEMAAFNRLTISVHVRFVNTKEEKNSYERSFSAYEDFEASNSFQQVEAELVEEIVSKLVDDIFNAAVANW